MSVHCGPKLASVSSLVLFLDATNKKSYPGTGTVWYDLSGLNNHFTLYNAPTYSSGNGGYLTFNGTNQYARSTATISLSSYSYLTIQYTFMTLSTAGGAGFELSANWNTTAGGLGLFLHSNGSAATTNSCHTNHNASVARNYNATMPTNGWCKHTNIFSRIADSTGRQTFINGEYKAFDATNGYATGNVTAAAAFANDYFYLASRGGVSNFCNMRIASVKVYGVKMTNDDIRQNFAAARSKFDIS